jgi:hypothetical protein
MNAATFNKASREGVVLTECRWRLFRFPPARNILYVGLRIFRDAWHITPRENLATCRINAKQRCTLCRSHRIRLNCRAQREGFLVRIACRLTQAQVSDLRAVIVQYEAVTSIPSGRSVGAKAIFTLRPQWLLSLGLWRNQQTFLLDIKLVWWGLKTLDTVWSP